MTLSILICTLQDRKSLLTNLLEMIGEHKDVEVLIDSRPRSVPTGTKRNDLISLASGKYFVFIDDDDYVTDTYVTHILKASEYHPDVITFEGWMTSDGKNRVNWIIELGEKYEERGGIYYRFPNHLCPMKKELVEHVKFPDIWQGEDYIWAKQINDEELLKSTVHIPEQLYHYNYMSQK